MTFCLCDCRSEKALESVEKSFVTHFDFDNKASVVFDRSFHSFFIKVCFQNEKTSIGIV